MNTQHSKDIKKEDMKSSPIKDAKKANDKTTASRGNDTDKKSVYNSGKDSNRSALKK